MRYFVYRTIMHVKLLKIPLICTYYSVLSDNFPKMNAISVTSIHGIISGCSVAAYFEASVSVQQTFNRRRIEADQEKEEAKDRENRSSFRS